MDAAVIFHGVYVIAHVAWLRIAPQHRIVVGCARFLHRADAYAVDVGGKQPLPDDPIRVASVLAQLLLLHQRAKHIRHMLVERAWLERIDKIGLVLGDAMGQLVADDINSDGKAVEKALRWGQVFVPVAVHHLAAVPEGIVVAALEVDG